MKIAYATAVATLVAVNLNPSVATATLVSRDKICSVAENVHQALTSSEISLGDFLAQIKQISGARGFVLMRNGKDLMVTNASHNHRNKERDYSGILLVRANDKAVFEPLKNLLIGHWQMIKGGGVYFPLV
ncbi:MAG: hypothetical protein WCF92_02875 [bacterium]